MPGHDNAGDIRLIQQRQQVFQIIAGLQGGFPIGRIGRDICRRGPGVIHRNARRAEVVAHLRLTVQAFGEVGVETMHEDEGLTLAFGAGRDSGVDGADEARAVGNGRAVHGQEIPARVRRRAVRGEGDGARFAVRRN